MANRHERRAAAKVAPPPRRPVAVMLGTPSPGYWEAPMAVDAITATVWAVAHGIYIEPRGAEGAYTETNRNNIVRSMLNHPNPIDAIMWIDADMRFPADTIARLWSHDKGIVGATYRERQEPYRYLGKLDDPEAEGLTRADLLPGGMIMVRAEVYRKMPVPWYKLDDDGMRDDYYFSRKARELGYEIWCDMPLTRKVRHRGDQEVGWFEEGEAIVRRDDDPRFRIFDPLLSGVPNGGNGFSAGTQLGGGNEHV